MIFSFYSGPGGSGGGIARGGIVGRAVDHRRGHPGDGRPHGNVFLSPVCRRPRWCRGACCWRSASSRRSPAFVSAASGIWPAARDFRIRVVRLTSLGFTGMFGARPDVRVTKSSGESASHATPISPLRETAAFLRARESAGDGIFGYGFGSEALSIICPNCHSRAMPKRRGARVRTRRRRSRGQVARRRDRVRGTESPATRARRISPSR